jgi:hypothetical protein
MYQKNVISKNVTKICTFSTFTHVRQTCFANNFFFVNFFLKLFQQIRNQHEILGFLTPFSTLPKNFFLKVILLLFSNFEAKRANFTIFTLFSKTDFHLTYVINASSSLLPSLSFSCYAAISVLSRMPYSTT